MFRGQRSPGHEVSVIPEKQSFWLDNILGIGGPKLNKII